MSESEQTFTVHPFGQAPSGAAVDLGGALELARDYVLFEQPDLDPPFAVIRSGGEPVGWVDGDGDYHEGERVLS